MIVDQSDQFFISSMLPFLSMDFYYIFWRIKLQDKTTLHFQKTLKFPRVAFHAPPLHKLFEYSWVATEY